MLHNHLRLCVFFSKLSGRAPLPVAEKPVKITQRIKPAIEAYTRHRLIGIHEFACSHAETNIHDEVRQALARAQLKEPRESGRRHADHRGELLEPDLLHVMC